MAVVKTAQKTTTEKTPVFSINTNVNWTNVGKIWALLSGGPFKSPVVNVLAKRLVWVSQQVLVNGKSLWEVWKYANARVSEAGVEPLTTYKEKKEVAIEVDSAVNLFLQALYDADVIGTTPPPHVYKDPITEAIELAWQIVYDGAVRYLVLRISSEGISAEVSRSFIGKPVRGFLRNYL